MPGGWALHQQSQGGHQLILVSHRVIVDLATGAPSRTIGSSVHLKDLLEHMHLKELLEHKRLKDLLEDGHLKDLLEYGQTGSPHIRVLNKFLVSIVPLRHLQHKPLMVFLAPKHLQPLPLVFLSQDSNKYLQVLLLLVPSGFGLEAIKAIAMMQGKQALGIGATTSLKDF